MDYVHINPVKHSHVEKVRDWPYSTFHRYIELGVYPEDWVSDPELGLDGGERSGVP
jgi:putative transposase